MTVISEIDEYGINTNLKVRYKQGRIYVSPIHVNILFTKQGLSSPRPIQVQFLWLSILTTSSASMNRSDINVNFSGIRSN